MRPNISALRAELHSSAGYKADAFKNAGYGMVINGYYEHLNIRDSVRDRYTKYKKR